MTAATTTIFSLVDHPEAAERAAAWFSDKWGLPAEAYRESIEAARADAPVPQWYLVCEGDDPAGAPIAGYGIIDNDFHDRPDLAPNLCALYVEEAHRSRGLARALLDHARAEMARHGLDRLYLVTDHDRFYERCGWEYLGDAHEDDGTPIRLYGADTLPPSAPTER